MNHEIYQQFSQEGLSKEAKFSMVVKTGIDLAKEKISLDYENNANPDSNLAYHSVWHTEGVIRRTQKLMEEAARVDASITQRDIEFATFIAACHDTVQRSYEEDVEVNGMKATKRKRYTGRNEEESYQFASDYMKIINAASGEEIFTQKDREIAKEAIMLTVPGFDADLGTVIQPDFSKSGLIAQIIALADLGGSGMEGGETAQYEALTLFDEENLDYKRYARLMQEPSSRRKNTLRDIKQENNFHQRLLDWIAAQKRFTHGREIALERDIDTIPVHVREAIRACFKKKNFIESQKQLDILSATLQKKTVFTDWQSEINQLLSTPPQHG